MLASAFRSLNASDRTALLAKSGVTEADFARKTDLQIAALARSFDLKQQERLVANAKFSAKELSYWNDAMLASAFRSLNASDRTALLAKSGVTEADFARKTDLQKAAFANVLGAAAFERTILMDRTFNRLGESQQRAVWARLGGRGQFAALRYAGVTPELARGDAMKMNAEFERILKERSSQ
jgi:uncharacterized protein